MSTSLAEQLQRLAVPQTSVYKRDKKRPSLLFDPGEAAKLDREAVLQIGIDGLEELIERDEVFAQFKNTLFHETSKEFQRAVQTAEANQRLDKNVKKFLFLLSPHFLFNCSYKALEWLIYRFDIQEYSREDLLVLILPYHETNIFVRVLQLFNLKSPADKWIWLKKLKTSGIHLPKQVLYNHAASDPYFLEFISTSVLSIIEEYENPKLLITMFNFYCTTYVGALEYTSEVSELQVTHMLPVLLKGLTSYIPDFVASSYVIVAKLLTKTSLGDTILDKFVEKIVQITIPSLKMEAVLLLIALYKSQSHYTRISDAAFRTLSGKEDISKIVETLNREEVDVYPLLSVLFFNGINGILVGGQNELNTKFVDQLFNELKIKDEFVDVLMISILESYSKHRKLSETSTSWLKDFVRRIERQYPNAFDGTVKKIMNPSSKDLRHLKKILRKLINNFTTIEHGYDLFEKLYHTNSSIKIQGLQIMLDNYDSFFERDISMLQNSLTDCFNDEDSDVVVETLRMFNSKLREVFDDKTLSYLLIKLLTNHQNQVDSWKVTYSALDVLCSHFNETNVTLFIYVLPFLLPSTKAELKAAKQILSSSYGKESQILSTYRQRFIDSSTPEQFRECMKSTLCECTHLPGVDVVVGALREIPEQNMKALHKQMAILLLSNCLPENSAIETNLLVLDIFENYWNPSKEAISKNNKVSLESFLSGVKTLIKKTQKEQSNFGLYDFSVNTHLSQFYIRILKMLLEGCNKKIKKSKAHFKTLNIFFKHFCGEALVRIVQLLLNITVAENGLIDDDLRLSCFKIAKMLLQNEHTRLDALVEFQGVTIPYILISLSMPSAEIREIGMDLLQIISKNVASDKNNYFKLLKKLLVYREEIVLDHDQIPMMMFNILPQEVTSSDSILKNSLDSLTGTLSNVTYPMYLRAGIVTLLSYMNDLDVYAITSKLALSILGKVSENSKKLTLSQSTIMYRNLLRFDLNVAPHVELDTPIWSFIKESIRNDTAVIQFQGKVTCPAALLLEQIDRELFANLKCPVQSLIVDLIADMVSNTKNLDTLNAAAQIFKRIDLDASLLLELMKKMRDARSPKQNETKRSFSIPTIDILETNDWKKGITILEFIQDKKKIRHTAVLVSVLFDILKKCLDFDEQSVVEYPKQLVMSAILHCCSRMEDQRLPENAFNIQAVVQCIRASRNPQTHHHALLLLAHTANLIPQQIMHNIISIFTFVGTSVLRQDDAYSFQIMSKVIETVIPILVKDGTEESVTNVLRVFVDAILDVPEHRRMPLFLQLLTGLDPNENLYIFLLIIFEAHVSHIQEEKQRPNKEADYLPKRLTIASDLLREFPVQTIIVSCIKLFQYLRNLPEQKEDSYTQNLHIFNMKFYTLKQFRHYKYTIITFLSSLLESEKFIMKVAEVPDDELIQMEVIFKELIINTLNFIQDTSKVAQRNANTPQAQYWKVMLHHSYDTLDAINALLHSKMFLLVIHGLMVYSLSTVRKRALELLNNKLQHNPEFFQECDKTELCNILVTSLINIVKTCDEGDLESDQELIIQKALFSLKLLCKLLAPEFPEKFVEILEYFTSLTKNSLGKLNENITASLILCVAELCNTLQAHSIPCLNKLMPILLKVLKEHRGLESPSLLITSNVAAINKILERLSLFLSPYVEKILFEIALIACKCNQADDQKLEPFTKKVTSIQQKLATVPINVLLPAIETSYTKIIDGGTYLAVKPLMDVLTETLTNMQGADIQMNLTEFTKFFLNALQFRASGESTHSEANEVEQHVVKSLLTLTLKLSESTFRPLYCQLFDWAVHSNSKSERVITFYNLSNSFAKSLKGLFVLFAGHFLNNAAKLLDKCNLVKNAKLYFEDEEKNIALVENILQTLHTVFSYDSQKFINKERFDVLMQPLVDQLENSLGGTEKLQARASVVLIPCIAQFAVAVADDSFWKQLNYQILLKTRHNSPVMRLLGLNCVGELAKKLGEDFMPLLPETVSFLAELLEDDEEEIEKSCKRTVQELEKVLGTSLQEYF